MSDPNKSNGAGAPQAAGPSLTLTGGAAIVAPASAFPNGLPPQAMVLLPITKLTDELTEMLAKGPVAVLQEQMWALLGFNGPAVQVQDDQGRPVAIGLDDLVSSLQKHWDEEVDDLNRGRILAQELLKYTRLEQAEAVLAKIVAKGGTGEDWLALGAVQLQQGKHDRAEGTLKGAQNLIPASPYPSLHLAKVAHAKGDLALEQEMALRAIGIDTSAVDAWAYYFQLVKEADGEEKALKAIDELADAPAHAKSVAPYVAVQGFYAQDEETRPKAIIFAHKAIERNPDDPVGLLCLSALYGASGNLQAVIELLAPHEGKMTRDVRLANNYFEALFQSRQLDKVKALLNALAGSPNRDVKQFAIERSRAVAQFLQQQAAQMTAATTRK